MLATKPPPIRINTSNLCVLFYSESQRKYETHEMRNVNQAFVGGEISVNPNGKTWKFVTRAGTEEYEIGRSLRVPEGDALWGPAYVFDPEIPEHVARWKRYKQEIVRGQVTR